MIAAVEKWHAVLCALLFFIPSGARAADDVNGAAHKLARKTAAFAGEGEPVSVEYRNVSSLGPAELGQARGAFEAALKEAGLRVSDVAPVAELRLTLSEKRARATSGGFGWPRGSGPHRQPPCRAWRSTGSWCGNRRNRSWT